MKNIKIPKERIGILIGSEGNTKKEIEKKTGINLEINSSTGEVLVDDHETEDPLAGFIVQDIVQAIGRGFSPEKAMKLLNEKYEFYLFDIRDYTGKKTSHVKRIKARIIGKNGKTKDLLEEITSSKLSIYGHTIGIISHIENMPIIKKGISMLIRGTPHGRVYQTVEKEMKDLRIRKKLESF
ncbi:MAG: KH domain-containing protein [Candidatus Thermoplasmatota archaeon]